jgi:hypothetical protein
MIDRNTTIEDLVREHPETVRLLMERDIHCLACGEPVWGTIGSTAADKGLTAEQIELLVDEINRRIGAV